MISRNGLRRFIVSLSCVASVVGVAALAAADRIAPPGPGLDVPPEVRQRLDSELRELTMEIRKTTEMIEDRASLNALLPDVLVFHKAVDWALRHDEFFKTNEFTAASRLVEEGISRARSLRQGEAPWTRQTGLVVRGYRSRIDGSVQPYGLVIPDGWTGSAFAPARLDVWLHGRDNFLTDLRFIDQRMRSRGEFAPDNAIVLHPYGRFCNAFKFAGETDVFEALEHVRQDYAIDENRVAMRGFSMGGAGCWHLSAHHPDRWFVSTPGAGFAESSDYLNIARREVQPTWYEQKLWRLYDATAYARNFANLPVIAYNGDEDKQKQAADVMEAAMGRQGLRLARVTGLDIGHKYTPEAKARIARDVDAISRQVSGSAPLEVRFATGTLRYAQNHWVRLEGLGEHWSEASVEASLQHSGVRVMTDNVTALRLDFGAGEWPFHPGLSVPVLLDGQEFLLRGPDSDRSWSAAFHRSADGWNVGPMPDVLRKRPGLQGPIDDVWFDSFLVVIPSSTPMSEALGNWTRREQDRLIEEWRSQFRGDARVKKDVDVTEEDVAAHHLVVFGDPHSNLILQRVLSELPLVWNKETVQLAGRRLDASTHAPVMIHPNPLNPDRYLVINGGFTWRDFPSNADQTPKLPDYALIDFTKPATRVAPGEVVHAGFFDERWWVRSERVD